MRQRLAYSLLIRLHMFFEGPRERLLARGPKALSDAELLAVLLRTGHRKVGEETNTPAVLLLAEQLLTLSGGLNGLLAITYQELQTITGLGDVKSAMLLSLAEIVKRSWCHDSSSDLIVENRDQAYQLFADLAYEEQEVLSAAFLNAQNKVIVTMPIYRGTLTGALVQPREILRWALKFNAAKILLAHNHPSQDPRPSDHDLQFSRRLQRVGQAMGIPLVDHLIICRGGTYFSVVEKKSFVLPIDTHAA